MELQYPRVLFTRGREGRDGWLPGEASNLIVASCLIITDTGFSFIEMTDLPLRKHPNRINLSYSFPNKPNQSNLI